MGDFFCLFLFSWLSPPLKCLGLTLQKCVKLRNSLANTERILGPRFELFPRFCGLVSVIQ